jgi:SAM-dependent methyltransferase
MDAPQAKGHKRFRVERAWVLDQAKRLDTQISKGKLAEVLALRGDEDVIDLGSGTGFYADIVAGMTRGVVYAIDIQPELHEIHRAKGLPPNMRLVLGDFTALPCEPDSVDLAYSVISYHETAGFGDLRPLARMLRPGGRLVVIDWRKDEQAAAQGPPLEFRFTREQVAADLTACFDVTGSEDVGDYLFVVVAKVRKPDREHGSPCGEGQESAAEGPKPTESERPAAESEEGPGDVARPT